MLIFKVLNVATLLLSLLGCGKQASNNKKIVYIDSSQVPVFLRNQKISCASITGDDCPEGVARVFVLNEDNPAESAMCSGFLIAPDRLITNYHCVSSQEQCEKTFISVYTGQQAQASRCVKLLAAKDDGPVLQNKAVDLAVLELEQAVGLNQYFNAPKKSIRPGERITTWVMDHQSLTRARLTEFECVFNGRQNSLELKNCPVILGNSGSPVINDYNEVVGVLWGTTYDESITEETPLELRRALNIFSYVTDVKHFAEFME
jgi:S1-C subfamily serine protease